MKTTARERIEKAATKKADSGINGDVWMLSIHDATELVMAEQARLKRRVNEKRKITGSMCSTSEFCKGYREACNDILSLWEE